MPTFDMAYSKQINVFKNINALPSRLPAMVKLPATCAAARSASSAFTLPRPVLAGYREVGFAAVPVEITINVSGLDGYTVLLESIR